MPLVRRQRHGARLKLVISLFTANERPLGNIVLPDGQHLPELVVLSDQRIFRRAWGRKISATRYGYVQAVGIHYADASAVPRSAEETSREP